MPIVPFIIKTVLLLWRERETGGNINYSKWLTIETNCGRSQNLCASTWPDVWYLLWRPTPSGVDKFSISLLLRTKKSHRNLSKHIKFLRMAFGMVEWWAPTNSAQYFTANQSRHANRLKSNPLGTFWICLSSTSVSIQLNFMFSSFPLFAKDIIFPWNHLLKAPALGKQG